jgi:hypothetical protein
VDGRECDRDGCVLASSSSPPESWSSTDLERTALAQDPLTEVHCLDCELADHVVRLRQAVEVSSSTIYSCIGSARSSRLHPIGPSFGLQRRAPAMRVLRTRGAGPRPTVLQAPVEDALAVRADRPDTRVRYHAVESGPGHPRSAVIRVIRRGPGCVHGSMSGGRCRGSGGVLLRVGEGESPAPVIPPSLVSRL